MSSELLVSNTEGKKDSVRIEDINKLMVFEMMFAIAYTRGLDNIGIYENALNLLKKANEDMKVMIREIDSNSQIEKIVLLNKIFRRYEKFQSTFEESEWLVMKEQAIAFVDADKYWAFSYICNRNILDWHELMVVVISEFRKLGILLYSISVQNEDGTIFYYLFNPLESFKVDCRDFVLQSMDIYIDLYIEEYNYLLSDGLLRKVWSKKDKMFRPAFWEPKGEKLREQFWNEFFLCCVCDRDLEED